MKYTYLLPSLILAGVLVIGVDATDDAEPDREEKAPLGNGILPMAPSVIPPILLKLQLSQEQEEAIRELINRTAAERRQTKDRNARREIQKRYDQSLMAVLTERQRKLLQQMRTPRQR